MLLKKIESGQKIDAQDLNRLVQILENMDKCHRIEEDQVLFQLKVKSKKFDEPIQALLDEHDAARKIFKGIISESEKWKKDQKPNTSLAGYLHNYASSLKEHVRREEVVFSLNETNLLSNEEHKNILERFKGVERVVLGPQSKEQMMELVSDLQRKFS